MMQEKTSKPKINPLLLSISKRFMPDLERLSTERQLLSIGDILTTLYIIPLALVGLVWLVSVTEATLVRENLGLLLLFFALIALFNQIGFFIILELRTSRWATSDGSLVGVITWSAIFIYGPTALWLQLLWTVINFIFNWRRARSSVERWSRIRNFGMSLAGETLGPLAALSLYSYFGGEFPLQGLTVNTIVLGFAILIAHTLLLMVLWSGYLAYHAWVQKTLTESGGIESIFRFFFLAIGLSHLAHPFAILGAGLYVQDGLPVYLFFIVGMLLVAFLTQQLSRIAESNRQQSRMLDRLEQLGRAIINAHPDEDHLPELLQEHMPNMFPAGRLVIWLFPDKVMYKQPSDWLPDLDSIWPWLLEQTETLTFLPNDGLPWQDQTSEPNPIILAPIQEVEGGQVYGGVFLLLHTLVQTWDQRALNNISPAVQSLTAQISSSFNQSRVYSQALEYQRVTEELRLAGTIQSSLLPYAFPRLPGWQIAVTLDPAGETSGDFFDIIPLDGEKIGLVIADVLDKGIGPALYMTLSRTLIRTYAIEFDAQPDVVFYAVNERILQDTQANLFVTVFYGVLDLNTGELIYCNAGHNPPYLLSTLDGSEPQALVRTGMPIGIDESTWENDKVKLEPGDVLVLYTDGIPEAQNNEKKFFKEESLVRVVSQHLGDPAEVLQKSILDAVYQFKDGAPQDDDITLMVLKRDESIK